MSTKIYEAYRIKEGVDPFDVMFDLKILATEAVKLRLRKWYEQVEASDDLRQKVVECERVTKEKPEDITLMDISTWCHVEYKNQLGSAYRGTWNLDVTLTIRRHEGRYYLIPYADSASLMRGIWHFLPDFPHLDEYGYWNNTDKPDHVSEEEWDERRDAWTAMIPDKEWMCFMETSVVSYDGWLHVDPWLKMSQERHVTKEADSSSIG